jgi:hypothetical protein
VQRDRQRKAAEKETLQHEAAERAKRLKLEEDKLKRTKQKKRRL